jgi:hypothetical protein
VGIASIPAVPSIRNIVALTKRMVNKTRLWRPRKRAGEFLRLLLATMVHRKRRIARKRVTLSL